MSQKMLETLHEVLQGIRGLPSDGAVAPLQARCEQWYRWLNTPHPVIAVVATDAVKTTPSFHEAMHVLEDPSLAWQVMEVSAADYAADIAVYTTMATTPWREDELDWLSSTVENAPFVLLLLLGTETLDEEETEDATDFAGRVLQSRMGNPSRFVGVAPTVHDALQMLRSHDASMYRRAKHVCQLLNESISESLAELRRVKEALAKEIAQAQHEYAQRKQRADAVLRELLVRENTLETRIAKIVKQTQVQFSEKCIELQRKYHRLCESEAILHISIDIENSLKSDIQQMIQRQMGKFADKLMEFSTNQVESVNALRESCGLDSMEIDPQRWVAIPYEVLPDPSLAAPKHVHEPFSQLRDVLSSLVAGGIVGAIAPVLALPSGLAIWFGLNRERRRRELVSFRNQFVGWVDRAISEAERQFGVYLSKVQDKIVSDLVEMYRSVRTQTSEHLAHLLQQHPLLSAMKSKQAQLSQLQSIAEALEGYHRRVLACNEANE